MSVIPVSILTLHFWPLGKTKCQTIKNKGKSTSKQNLWFPTWLQKRVKIIGAFLKQCCKYDRLTQTVKRWQNFRISWEEYQWEHILYAFCELNICVLTSRWNLHEVPGPWGQSSSVVFVGKTPKDLAFPSATWSYNRQMVFSHLLKIFYPCFIDCRAERLYSLPHGCLYFILHCLYNYVK